jgi:multicomponent Na+:H+ antiporter subunit A
LVDFRALDTLGEITVLALAAAGVFTLLRFTPKKKKSEK